MSFQGCTWCGEPHKPFQACRDLVPNTGDVPNNAVVSVPNRVSKWKAANKDRVNAYQRAYMKRRRLTKAKMSYNMQCVK